MYMNEGGGSWVSAQGSSVVLLLWGSLSLNGVENIPERIS